MSTFVSKWIMAHGSVCGVSATSYYSEMNMTYGDQFLKRLKTFIDVVYAIIFWKILDYLPHFEDMAWVDKPLGLMSNFIENPDDSLRIIIGLGLVIIYWIQNNRLLNILHKTNIKHSAISILQLIFVCLFVYFAIADPNLKGGSSSLVLQSASLAIAGFVGLAGFRYAVRNDFIDGKQAPGIVRETYTNVLPEPITATINIGLAFYLPIIWTLAWIILPIIIRIILKKKLK